MGLEDFAAWALDKLISLLMSSPGTAIYFGIPMAVLGTFSAFSTIIFQAAHKIVLLTKTNRDDQFVARAQIAWESLENGPFGFVIKRMVKFAYFTPPTKKT